MSKPLEPPGEDETRTFAPEEAPRENQEYPARWGQLLLRKLLGQGAFGEVFLAWDPELDREVALKLMRRERHELGIRSEARLLAKVRHENVAVVYGVAEHDGRAGLWMEYIQGRTLDQLIEVQGRLGAHEAVAVGAVVCRALAAVHQIGLLHCDIKAQNVMRADGGRIVLMDFGLGQVFGQDANGQLRGTLVYMAPELLEGRPPSIQSDIYATGVLLYYLVTGSFPVEGNSLSVVRENHRLHRATLLGDVRPDLPESYLRVVARATAESPAERFETAGQMLQALTPVWTQSEVPPQSFQTAVPARPVTRRTLLRNTAIAGVGAVAVGSAWSWKLGRWPWSAATAGGYIHAIAVLPFENFSAAPESDYFSDGLTEELINVLAAVPGLRVVARTSAFRFRGKNIDVRRVGRTLNVDSLITGSIRRSDNEVRTAVQLISTSDDSQRWSEIYDLPLKNIFAVQESIAHRVADQLQLRFTPRAAAEFTEATDLYLKGLFHFAARIPSEQRLAIHYFEQAIGEKPDYAKAWAGMALAWLTLGFYDSREAEESRVKAKPAMDRALQLDPGLAEAWHARGTYLFLEWAWKEAENSLVRATSINASYAGAWERYANMLGDLGRYQESLVAATRALALDPLSATASDQLGISLYFLRDYVQSAKQHAHSLDLEPRDFVAHIMLGWGHLALKEWGKGTAEMQLAVQQSADNAYAITCLACAYALSGKPDDARRLVRETMEKYGDRVLGPVMLASVAAVLDERDTAFKELQRGVAGRDPLAVQLLVNPALASIRPDPRFANLLLSMAFPAVKEEK